MRLDGFSVFIAQFLAWEQQGWFACAGPAEDGQVEVHVLDDQVWEAALREAADTGLLPPRAAHWVSGGQMQALRGAELGFLLRAPIGVPVVQSDHIAHYEVEESVCVPIGEDGVAVSSDVAVVWALGASPMVPACWVGGREASDLRRAAAHALRRGEAEWGGR